jgi:hypothetical protein
VKRELATAGIIVLGTAVRLSDGAVYVSVSLVQSSNAATLSKIVNVG